MLLLKVSFARLLVRCIRVHFNRARAAEESVSVRKSAMPHRQLFRIVLVVCGCIAVFSSSSFAHAQSYIQFVQQGPKLTASDLQGPVGQGTSVALSGDGNTMLVGAPYETNANTG